jgi:beta-mannosidase
MNVQSLSGSWQFRQSGNLDWLPATVPGGVHTDLLANGLIPDPFSGDNEKRVQWVAQQDWEYRLHFHLDPSVKAMPQIWLVCDGLDTLAEISLNGELLGRTANMFRQYRWDVKALLSDQDNELRITFASPVQYCAAKQAIRPLAGVSQAIPGGPYLRKAPCQFGWDWGPQLPPVGIWKDIRLEGYGPARFDQVHLRQTHQSGQVRVSALVSVEQWQAGSLRACLTLTDPDGETLTMERALKTAQGEELELIVANPKIWWPNGYGEQNLYHVKIQLFQDGQLLDENRCQIGLRTLELRQQPDEWGRSFTFVVNGVPIFAKGANWIPADSFPTHITPASMENLIQSAAAAHQNMLRVWGGGFYEDERFYDLCDRYGLLVWQDMLFACSIYPLDDPAFVENLHTEIRENIRRLRHRASLALWCGNNEMEQGWVEWQWDTPENADLKAAYARFFHETLAAWCTAEDPDHAYWPSSPSSDTPFEDPNGQRQGDAHYWEVWHGLKPFTAYRTQFPRFMSEFGFQALPPLATIRTFAPEAEWNMTSYVMEQHQKNQFGNQLIVAQMLDSFRMPKDFESLVYLSQILQAEGIRYGVEHWRRYPQRVSGTLYWQLNDCWPVASWSSLDYYRRWKALHYAARRFYAPVLLSIENKPTQMDIWISSDLQTRWQGDLQWSLETLQGQPVAGGSLTIDAEPLNAACLAQIDCAPYLDDDARRSLVFIAELRQHATLVARQSAFFVPVKHLSLSDPQINAVFSQSDENLRIQLSAHNYACLVEVALSGSDAVFSENYFDLPAGRSIEITVPMPAIWSLDQVRKAFKVRSVFDSYAHSAA